ncbi:MAG: hypothetical protein F4Y07_05160 [Gemmatimonadetes bacterium]|nr:hypothetical protein [Gemmatimonadota bacterium]
MSEYLSDNTREALYDRAGGQCECRMKVCEHEWLSMPIIPERASRSAAVRAAAMSSSTFAEVP